MSSNQTLLKRQITLSEENHNILKENQKENSEEQQVLPSGHSDNEMSQWFDNENYILGYN
ncbi:MAG: hypothetical protein HRT53_00960 [Colwellia sp.]|nr:hypothetical protein [Colwellia sp.]